VAPVPVMMDAPIPFAGTFDDGLSALRRNEAKDYLEDVAAQVTAGGVEARPTAVLAANPVEAIRAAAQAPGVGMIAVATHGRSGLRRLVLGSVADKLIRTSELPVLVTRPRGR
jgi:nucleotide-binding universal stress UspA family protein